MKDINEILDEDLEEDVNDAYIMDSSNSNIKFKCPNCGEISRDDVLFLCNTCDASELIQKDGVYMCPSCLKPGENFECALCGSDAVEMKIKK